MEYEEYTVRNNTYRVVPITFQSYNAKGFGEYEKGFEPDILMDETNPYNEQGVFYIHKDYGNNEEPLYAKAIELITGTNPAPKRAVQWSIHWMVKLISCPLSSVLDTTVC